MTARPSGTVTFLFTDVAGSTRLWEADHDGMAASLAMHDGILKRSIDAHQGFVFATGGDSFSAAFPTAREAVATALEVQLGLADQVWDGPAISVRMGIHTGSAEERDGDYFGPAVSRAARIMSVGHGGQVLLSTATAELVRDRLRDGVSLVDRGVHDLKGMARGERIFELRHPSLAIVSAPLAGASSGGVHLPEQLTSFVGRATETTAVTDLLDRSRLVTLTGIGGTGKTRLAVEAARAKADDFADGVWMAQLAPITDDSLVLQQIADTWELRPGEGVTLEQVVRTYLSTRKLLLLVDNCEHVLAAVIEAIPKILSGGPAVSVLATSRGPIGVPGEAVYQVPSMALPAEDAAALKSDAVALFLDRFRAARPGYEPTSVDLAAILRVCRRLDGIPLGMELAAARLRTLSPADLADRLDESFRILGGSRSTGQRTLEATIDWSYRLLDAVEAQLFRWASVFTDGFDLQAIEAVGVAAGIDDWEVIDLVEQLVDKSLFAADVRDGRSRFRILEPIRAFGSVRLEESGDRDAARSAHAAHYATWVANVSPGLRGRTLKDTYELIAGDIDNLRAALFELRDSGRVDEFLAMYFDLVIFWSQASMQAEALELALPVLESNPVADPRGLARAWWATSSLAFNLTDPKSVDYGERAIAAAREAGDAMSEGWASVITAQAISGTTPRTDTNDYLETGVRLVLDNLADDPWWDPQWDLMYLELARVFVAADPVEERTERVQASLEERKERLQASIEQAKALGDRFTAAWAMTIGYFMREGDEDPGVRRDLEEAVQILSEFGFRHAHGHALVYWGGVTKDRDDEHAGDAAITLGAEILAEIGDIPCSLQAIDDAVGYHVEHGRIDRALAHLVFASRQAMVAPKRFASWVTRMACKVAVGVGDLGTAALVLGHRSDKDDASLDGCRHDVSAGLEAVEMERLLAEGARLGHAGVVEFVGSWAEGQLGS